VDGNEAGKHDHAAQVRQIREGADRVTQVMRDCLDRNAGPAPDVAVLAALRQRFPAAEIIADTETGVFIALMQPTPTARHVVAAYTLEKLAAKLEAAAG
jgi:hypothetical protein